MPLDERSRLFILKVNDIQWRETSCLEGPDHYVLMSKFLYCFPRSVYISFNLDIFSIFIQFYKTGVIFLKYFTWVTISFCQFNVKNHKCRVCEYSSNWAHNEMFHWWQSYLHSMFHDNSHKRTWTWRTWGVWTPRKSKTTKTKCLTNCAWCTILRDDVYVHFRVRRISWQTAFCIHYVTLIGSKLRQLVELRHTEGVYIVKLLRFSTF